NNEVISEPFQYLRIRPHHRLHFPAVRTTVPGKVNEKWLIQLPGTFNGLVIIEVTGKAVGKVQKIGVQRLLAGGVRAGRSRALRKIEIVRMHWRQITCKRL